MAEEGQRRAVASCSVSGTWASSPPMRINHNTDTEPIVRTGNTRDNAIDNGDVSSLTELFGDLNRGRNIMHLVTKEILGDFFNVIFVLLIVLFPLACEYEIYGE